MNNLGRIVAYAALAGALLATAISWNNRQYPAGEGAKSWPSLALNGLDGEVARCRTTGLAAADDAGCRRFWAVNRKRFLQSANVSHHELAVSDPVTSDLNGAAAATGWKVPKTVPRSPTTQSSPRPPGETTGHPQ
jgi:conjugative transfer region protein TrbK